MAKQNLKPAAVLVLLLSLFQGCASSEKTAQSSEQPDSKSVVTVNDNAITLADYLSRVPGVYIQGSGDNISINIRGSQSISGTNRPLFVVNRQQVGRSYSVVNAIVDVNDIENIEVLKGSEAGSRYGLRGSNGVIIIKTKTSESDKKARIEELLKKYGGNG
ncbi:TonB-dependent receptor plug domain-containing protein [Balneolaceae bacterium YR4-1]|uniref:TonB-dependent receptor plug domain-containing protein n=1 Tax=Halalkalibaculum roseum TaxID=2709311 RepID=A0A6M1T7P6_9BACT|nr:TonB-dependent receptor plug domain-containing protein [Halalkalibaculum roseum]NGP77975.1 TonB-dependent receptor plug domain-containing protein [Halalkalibaculum roseum]